MAVVWRNNQNKNVLMMHVVVSNNHHPELSSLLHQSCSLRPGLSQEKHANAHIEL